MRSLMRSSVQRAAKMIAAKRKGRWIGGKPPLGYDVHPDGGRLVVNEEEAQQVREIFDLYRTLGSLTQTLDVLRTRGWKTKSWETRSGTYDEGGEWKAASLRNLLANPVYIGKVQCRGKTHAGEHEPIFSHATWDAVQRALARNGNDGARKTKNRHGEDSRSKTPFPTQRALGASPASPSPPLVPLAHG